MSRETTPAASETRHEWLARHVPLYKWRMVSYSVNTAAVNHATALIDAGKVVLHSDWSEAQPSPDDENSFIDQHGWDAYALWYLAINDDHDNPHAKNHYGFAYGDFERVHRQGLIGAIDRAAEWHHAEIETTARALLDHLDRLDRRTP